MYGGASLAIGSYIWFMSRDDQAIDYDPRKHTEKMYDLLQEEWFTELDELLCIYLQKILVAKRQESTWKDFETLQEISVEFDEAKLAIYSNLLRKYHMDDYTAQEYISVNGVSKLNQYRL